MATSKYFCEGVDFYKRQLHRHHPDLEGMGIDLNLIKEEEEVEENKEKEEENKEKGEEKGKTSPFSP